MGLCVCVCVCGSSHLDGGPQDGELRRVPAGLVSLQNLLDELLDLALGHPISVSRLPEDVDALRQFIIDAGLAERRAHDTRESVCVCVCVSGTHLHHHQHHQSVETAADECVCDRERESQGLIFISRRRRSVETVCYYMCVCVCVCYSVFLS